MSCLGYQESNEATPTSSIRCCGTHLPSIHNLQLFLLPHTDALARSATSTARLYFLAGPRLIAHLASTHALLNNTASFLSVGAPLVPDRVTQVVEDRKKAEKRVEDLEIELAKIITGDLVGEIKNSQGGQFKKHLHRTDDTGNALGFLSAISFALADASSNMSLGRPYLIILSSSPSAQTVTSTTIVVVLGADDKTVKAAGDALKAKLSIKGGGKGLKWSGKFIGVWKAKEDSVIEDILKDLV